MIHQGYPEFVFIPILLIGLFLAYIRPYEAFLFSILLLIGCNRHAFVYTRTSFLGPYFNLNDACFLIALIALCFQLSKQKRFLHCPMVLFLIAGVLLIGFSQSLLRFGWTYETLRSLRWAVEMPIGIFLGANMVKKVHHVKNLLLILCLAVVLSAIQHFWWVYFLVDSMPNYTKGNIHLFRTVSFMSGGIPSALVAAVVVYMPLLKINKLKIGYMLLAILVSSVLVASIVLNQTRSVYLAIIITIPILICLFYKRHSKFYLLRLFILILVISGCAFGLVKLITNNKSDAIIIVKQRLGTLTKSDPKQAYTSSRINQFKFETKSWLKGSLVFGRGLWFFQDMEPEKKIHSIAFGHLGYVTYLSQLGLFGLFVYGFYLPYRGIVLSRLVWRNAKDNISEFLAVFATSAMLFNCIRFTMSESFLSSEGFVATGVLFGAVWGLAKSGHSIPHRNALL